MFVRCASLCSCLPQPLQLLLYTEGAGIYWGNMFPSRSDGSSIPVGAAGPSWELSRQMVPLSRQSCSRAGILHGSGLAASGTGFPARILGLEITAPHAGTAL